MMTTDYNKLFRHCIYVPLNKAANDYVYNLNLCDTDSSAFYVWLLNPSDYNYLLFDTNILVSLNDFTKDIVSDYESPFIWATTDEEIENMLLAKKRIQTFIDNGDTNLGLLQIIYMMDLAVKLRTRISFQL